MSNNEQKLDADLILSFGGWIYLLYLYLHLCFSTACSHILCTGTRLAPPINGV